MEFDKASKKIFHLVGFRTEGGGVKTGVRPSTAILFCVVIVLVRDRVFHAEHAGARAAPHNLAR